MKKTWNILTQVFTWLVVLLAVCMAVFTIISLRTVDASQRNLFGYKAFIVRSDSMAATDFASGDLIFVKETQPQKLAPGDIIAYVSRNEHNYGETVTHKIRRITTDERGNPGFITYGTTTGTDDEAVVAYGDVLGVYIGRLAGVGRVFAFLKTPAGYVSMILLPFLLIIGYCGWNCWKLFRQYRQEEKAERDAQIAAERKENEELRREIQELKAAILGGKLPAQPAPAEEEPPQPRRDLPERRSSAPEAARPTQTPPARRPKTRKAQRPEPEDELDFESIMREFGAK